MQLGWSLSRHSRHHHLTLADTELSDLLPVTFDPTQKMGIGSVTSAQLQLTEAGSASLLTKLADSLTRCQSWLWRNLPGSSGMQRSSEPRLGLKF